MLVGPPGTMKSTFLDELDHQYHDCLTLTDLNAKSLVALRDRVAGGSIKTLVFPEYQKIYERKGDTSANLEGSIRALVQEGFTAAAFENAGINRLRARAMVIGAITPSTQNSHSQHWEDTGFSRRFLWLLYRLNDPGMLERAIIEWNRIKIKTARLPQLPSASEKIPNLTTAVERRHLQGMVKYQPGGSSTQQLQLLAKTLSVIKWWYRETGNPRNAMEIFEALRPLLGREGGLLELGEIPANEIRNRRKKETAQAVSLAAKTLSRVAGRKRKKK